MFVILRHLFILGVMFLGWSPNALADFSEGEAAYNNGDYAEALKQWQPLAEQGNALAQNSLGSMYGEGLGVVKDNAKAIEWYRKAADQGLAYAQFNLGLMYNDGEGSVEDPVQAMFWYRKAADQGVAYAQFNLGIMYINGRGVAEDPAQGIVWVRKAADKGLADAQYTLGLMYNSGRGTAQDPAQAMFWFRKAADQKFVTAQYALGYKYANGEGVEKDEAQAVFWLRKAANQGFVSAQKALEEMKAKENTSITPSLPQPAEVKAAIQRAVDFIDIDTFDIQTYIIGRLRSADVLKVPGCIYESKQKINCIVQLDFGMGKILYMQLPLEYKYNYWEAPILEKLADKSKLNPAVPYPTVEQAQKAVERFARNQKDKTSEIINAGLVKIISIKPDCKLNESDGTVSCNVQLSWRDKKEQQEEIKDRHFSFHLKGSEWQFGPLDNAS
ncbi:tetratricopeptide repeat protein [Serratia aquatilis]|uniref:Tetratricopeptide repeat protein n=1 Tax=Serratia aquatilis TaxID=1737515 RepID=A0ABV6EGH5_9GAMM